MNKMETLTKTIKVTEFKIGETAIILENFDYGQGKITVKDYNHGVYSHYWGAMGGTLEDFLLSINSDYFADKLLGRRNMHSFDAKKTFRNVRKFIREEIGLPWYKHLEFQEDLREKLNTFQSNCVEYNSEHYFIDHFDWYLSKLLSFNRIEDRYDREDLETAFKEISEPWGFIETSESETTKWLKKLHTKIKKPISTKTYKSKNNLTFAEQNQ